MSSSHCRSFQIGGSKAVVRIFPATKETAPSIVALHGFTGSGLDFGPLRTAMGLEEWHWICPDFMGHGLSQSPADLEAYSLDNSLRLIEFAQSCVPLGSKAHLLGYSMGGRIALHYLKNSEARLPAALIGASPGISSVEDRRIRLLEDQRVINILLNDGIEAFAQFWESQPIISTQTKLTGPLSRELASRRRENTVRGLVNSLMACGTAVLPSLWDELDSINRLSCLYGDQDQKFGEIAHQMADKNPKIEKIPVVGTGHAPHLEAPESLASCLQMVFSH